MSITIAQPEPAATTRGRSACRRWLGVALAAAVLVVLPLESSPYHNLQFTLAAVWIVAAVGLNLLTGYNGQLSLASSAFLALGAYTAGILVTKAGWPYWATLPAAGALSFLVGIMLGPSATRLKGLYLALMTLAIAVAAAPLIDRFQSLTGGVQGMVLPQVQAPSWSGLANDQWLYAVAVVVAVLALVLLRNLLKGQAGRAIVAQKDNVVVAEVMGVRVLTYRTLVFAYSTMLTGVAGALYACVVGLLSPDAFAVMLSVTLLAGVVVGGTGTIVGSVIAGIFVEFMPVVTDQVSQALSGVVYGVLVIAVMLLMPQGVAGAVAAAGRRLVGRSAQHAATAGSTNNNTKE